MRGLPPPKRASSLYMSGWDDALPNVGKLQHPRCEHTAAEAKGDCKASHVVVMVMAVVVLSSLAMLKALQRQVPP